MVAQAPMQTVICEASFDSVASQLRRVHTYVLVLDHACQGRFLFGFDFTHTQAFQQVESEISNSMISRPPIHRSLYGRGR